MRIGFEPRDQKMTGDPFAQTELQAFLEKGLGDRERQQNGDDAEERPQKVEKFRQLLAAQGVEELAVPFIQPHLPGHVADGDGDRGNEDRHHAPTAWSPT